MMAGGALRCLLFSEILLGLFDPRRAGCSRRGWSQAWLSRHDQDARADGDNQIIEQETIIILSLLQWQPTPAKRAFSKSLT